FTTLEEVAYVDAEELASLDGVDAAIAEDLQARARESLEEMSTKALEDARALGVEEELIEFDGLTPQMILALAKDGVLTLHEFATCADWELAGGWSQIDGKRVKENGLLEEFDMSLEEAQSLVMTARVIVGLIDASDVVFEGEEEGVLYEDELEAEEAEGEDSLDAEADEAEDFGSDDDEVAAESDVPVEEEPTVDDVEDDSARA
ncbi:MAG: N utilization substance protein A, partial [Paracoccaceae bacterium]